MQIDKLTVENYEKFCSDNINDIKMVSEHDDAMLKLLEEIYIPYHKWLAEQLYNKTEPLDPGFCVEIITAMYCTMVPLIYNTLMFTGGMDNPVQALVNIHQVSRSINKQLILCLKARIGSNKDEITSLLRKKTNA